ncbi:UDP-3-O-(3-hydroxymyristoyl) glucosamine N-acyltransferase [Aneurinibacillus migulanus]|jgi:acetyltransferase-like isoleucine patch superfamily enzyme|uniref:Hexapeptide repeat of succinyl-transferase n=1 Tax=Aneurinibacillus migulanus TaxID=47500 RepID=A0A0M0GXM3_ANEMI|nr:N-acetyltransferase [Aneurinibacillus migulanus]KON94548.1 UDP-3-O-(3-hydroxymyristoyl) glucosamine N-acyltransferase [Aneurinibacillus migulanus]KPD05593.1 UDP-3-O-(3-hydroxymyristoyl) glucosamine N-acyltransferase [Aneurinibacillus migulanus]MCP1357001.1 N-acetyltransferase [Aneurinibacillus migulanus]MED0892583.1 DapH/DapD/GlmU-related protein [Aneurinibacillus migulanus]MED1615003.1 DapH/DapD/GlmU-related protein [Aneurinibacillus migulanus]
MNITFGKNTIIEDSVVLGENVTIGHNVIIYEGSVIGDNVIIQDNVIIGKQPTKAKNSVLKEVKKNPPVIIGDGCTIGTSSIIYAGAILENDVFVADLATIRERVTVGERTIVGRGVAIENDCTIGRKCKLETNCYITAYSNLGNYVFVAPCVVTSNDNYMARSKERFDKMKGVTVKDGGRIGANAITLPGITIEEDGTVAAGSIVTRDVKKEELVVGIPAKKLRDVPQDQLLRNQE